MKTEILGVLFTDVSKSAPLEDSLGDTLDLDRIGECFTVITRIAEENNGKVIKTLGDEIMLTFQNADSALLAATSIQETVTRAFAKESPDIQLKIGLHYGEVVVDNGDVFGTTINTAERLVNLATPGQILTTEATTNAATNGIGSRTLLIGKFPIRGNQEMTRVYEVLLSNGKGDPEATLPLANNLPPGCLLLRHRDQEVRFHEEGRIVSMGRDPRLDLVLSDDLTSRNHASIECSNDRFLLEDHSTNGTFLFTDEDEVIHLHQEKCLLQGSGQISLGREPTENPTELIQFDLRQS